MRSWGNYNFEWEALLRPETDDADAIQAFLPSSAYLNPQNLELHPYGSGPFCKFRIFSTCDDGGVYLLLVNNTPVYVGECANLINRFNQGYGAISPRDCYIGGRPTACRINHLIFTAAKAGQQIELWFCKTTNRQKIAGELIKLLKPSWNQ